ncbi:MAG: hypothetical protein JO212_12940 [Acetobacteraceae bacterium]|nr:hypothetical protein [Acetobacteraceae bacterium]
MSAARFIGVNPWMEPLGAAPGHMRPRGLARWDRGVLRMSWWPAGDRVDLAPGFKRGAWRKQMMGLR